MESPKKTLPNLTGKEKNIGLVYLVFQYAFLPVLLQLVGQVFSLGDSDTLYNFLYFSINFICVIAIFSKFLKKSVLRVKRFQQDVLSAAAIGFGAFWLSSSLLHSLTQLFFPEFVNLNDSSLVNILGEYPVLLFLSTVILAPVAEEVLHRGLIFGWLREKNVWAAYSLSALLFAAIHVVQYIGLYSPLHMLIALVQYLPAGIVFAWAYQRSGCIFAPIAIHAANNLLAILTVR